MLSLRTSFFAAALMLAPLALSAQQAATAPAVTMPDAKPVEQPFVFKADPLDVVIGKSSAPVTVVEYASLSCPHCAHFYGTTFPTLKTHYIDKGTVKLVYRHFPLNVPAMSAAKLIACVTPAQKETFLKVLFMLQEKWAFDVNSQTGLANIAGVGGISPDKFKQCEADKDMETKILEVENTAQKNGWVKSTPTFFINGKKLEGFHPFEDFQKEIDPLLKK